MLVDSLEAVIWSSGTSATYHAGTIDDSPTWTLSERVCNDRHRVVIWAESMLQLSQMSDPGVCLVYLVQIVSVDSA